jgi:hypothetical protein
LRFPGGASPSQFDDSQTRNKSPEWFFPSHARVGTLGRMKRVARSHRAPDRVRATTASFRAPASDFSPSLSLCRFRIERTKRCVLRVRVLVSNLVSCTRVVDPDPFISFHFIPTAFFAPGYACPGVRARTSARTRHFGDAESDEWRRRVWDRRECARFDWTRRDPDGWMDGWIPIRAATATVSFG